MLKDQAGTYFVLPQEVVEQGRVPAERTAEIEGMIAEQQDTQGHFLPWAPIVSGYVWYRILRR